MTLRTKALLAHNPVTVEFGDLVTAAFDVAARRSDDPAEVSRLATGVVRRLMATQRPLDGLAHS